VCCSDTQGWLGFPWPLPRGWAKTCATLPWPLSGWSLQFVFFLLTRRSPRGGSGCQGCAERTTGATEERKEPGLDAGASAAYRASPSSRKTAAARGRPGERLPSGAHPRGLPGHGKPSTAFRSAAHSPASARPLDLPWERSDLRGEGGHAAPALPASSRQHCVRHACTLSIHPHAQGLQPWSASTAACLIHPPALRSGQTVVAVLLVRAARPGLDAGARRQYIPHAYKQGGQAAEDP